MSVIKYCDLFEQLMYVTTTSPYVFMTVLLIRGATLPGAGAGIKYYLIPDVGKLADSEVELYIFRKYN